MTKVINKLMLAIRKLISVILQILSVLILIPGVFLWTLASLVIKPKETINVLKKCNLKMKRYEL
jgi:hypothetical protein